MSDEIDREITTRKVTSNSNTPSDEYRVSEQRTSQVRNDDNSNGLILGILLVLAVGAGAAIYFMNNRPAPTQILAPAPANNTVRENKSTVIERNNTTTREVAPAPSQPTPRVEINVPSSAPQPTPRVEINVPPAPAVTTAPSPAATAQPQTTASPRPTN